MENDILEERVKNLREEEKTRVAHQILNYQVHEEQMAYLKGYEDACRYHVSLVLAKVRQPKHL